MVGSAVGKLLVIVGGVLLAVSSASAGPAAWCKGAKPDEGDLSRLNSKDARDIVLAYVNVECGPTPEVEAHRAEIEAGRAAWSKKLGMVEADWADAVAWAQKNHDEIKPDLSTKKLSEMTPIDQYAVMFDNNSGDFDAIYLGDVFDAKLSEVGRLEVIHSCIRHHSEGGNEVIWAACAQDIASFNLQKFSDELRADSAHKGEIKQKLRILAFNLANELKDHDKEVKELLASDPAWKKLFELGAQARVEWPAIAAKNAEYLALASDLESAFIAQSRSMFEGCDARTYAALGKAVGELKADTFKKMFDVRMDPFKGFGYQAAPTAMKTPSVFLSSIAVALCNQRKGLAGLLGSALEAVPSLRGPRNYAVGKMEFSGIQLDKVGAKIEKTRLQRPYSSRQAAGYMRSIGAPIKSIKKKDGKLEITPTALMVKREDCVKEHTTNHIDRVVNGELRYEIQCDKTAMVMHDEAWMPFSIDTRYEGVVKPGMLISVSDQDVIAIWPSANATKPSWILAGPIK
ncbi:hypothetical protein BH11MYX1_BH11MYX1_18940 [soil metagenome]